MRGGSCGKLFQSLARERGGGAGCGVTTCNVGFGVDASPGRGEAPPDRCRRLGVCNGVAATTATVLCGAATGVATGGGGGARSPTATRAANPTTPHASASGEPPSHLNNSGPSHPTPVHTSTTAAPRVRTACCRFPRLSIPASTQVKHASPACTTAAHCPPPATGRTAGGGCTGGTGMGAGRGRARRGASPPPAPPLVRRAALGRGRTTAGRWRRRQPRPPPGGRCGKPCGGGLGAGVDDHNNDARGSR